MSPKKYRQSRLSLETFVKVPSVSMKKKHARLSGNRSGKKRTSIPVYIRKQQQKKEEEYKKIQAGSTKWQEFLEASGISPEEKGWDCVGLYNVYGTPTAWSKKMVKTDDYETDSEDDNCL